MTSEHYTTGYPIPCLAHEDFRIYFSWLCALIHTLYPSLTFLSNALPKISRPPNSEYSWSLILDRWLQWQCFYPSWSIYEQNAPPRGWKGVIWMGRGVWIPLQVHVCSWDREWRHIVGRCGGGELCGKWGLLPLQFRLAYDCTATERSAVALKHYHWFLFSRRLYKAANIKRRNRRLISRSNWDQKMPQPFVEVLVLFVSMKQICFISSSLPFSQQWRN